MIRIRPCDALVALVLIAVSHTAARAQVSDEPRDHEPTVTLSEPLKAATKTGTPRPAWVDRPAGLYSGVYETKVLVGPEATREALDRATTEAVRNKIREYVATLGSGVDVDQWLLDEAKLRRNVVGEQWEEQVRTAAGDGMFLHTQLRFDSRTQNQWQAQAKQRTTEVRSRLLMHGFLAALWAVLVAHVALRLDGRGWRLPWRAALWLVALVLAVWPAACECFDQRAIAAAEQVQVDARAKVEVLLDAHRAVEY